MLVLLFFFLVCTITFEGRPQGWQSVTAFDKVVIVVGNRLNTLTITDQLEQNLLCG